MKFVKSELACVTNWDVSFFKTDSVFISEKYHVQVDSVFGRYFFLSAG